MGQCLKDQSAGMGSAGSALGWGYLKVLDELRLGEFLDGCGTEMLDEMVLQDTG